MLCLITPRKKPLLDFLMANQIVGDEQAQILLQRMILLAKETLPFLQLEAPHSTLMYGTIEADGVQFKMKNHTATPYLILLEKKGFIEIIRNPGYPNLYIINEFMLH